MHKLLASTYKEFLLLTRDFGGLAILFIMPILLVITITVIQDGTFKIIKETKIPILWINNDQGKTSNTIYEGMSQSQSFELITKSSEEEAKQLVAALKKRLLKKRFVCILTLLPNLLLKVL